METILSRQKTGTEKRLLQERSTAALAMLQKQAEIVKENEERIKKNREFTLRMKFTNQKTEKHAKQLEYHMKQKQIEFDKCLEKVKIDQETVVKRKELENVRP